MPQEPVKILLIEHDPAFAGYLSQLLGQARDLSPQLSWAEDLATGLAALHRTGFDALVMDLSLPDGAGLGNIRLIKTLAPKLPIIIAGASEDEIVAVEAAHVGAQDYLVKGQLTPRWLEHSIRYAIERHQMEAALFEAEEKYHGLFDHLVEGIFQTTPGGRYLLANAALARIYGYSSPEELKQELTDIGRKLYVEEGRRETFIRMMQESDTISRFESQVRRRDGAFIWISENCRAIRDPNGQLLYYEGTVEDITQRRQAEQNLRNSEALYHSLVETLPQNIFRKDLQGRFTFANQQFCRSLGRSLEEIVGKTDADFFPPGLAEKYRRDDRRLLETGNPYETVEEHQPPAGAKMFVQVVKTPLYDAEGKVMGLQGIFWDITQQRVAEEKIRRINASLSQSRKELRLKNIQMEQDLKMAGEIQLAMLPQQYPVFPKPGAASESAFCFTHRYLPTGGVGGDFFSVSSLSEHEVAVFICDVAGHGVRSALVTAMIRALVEELKPLAFAPGDFLTKLNFDLFTILQHTGTPMLTTAFYLVADAQTGLMRYSNAGHPRPLHVRRRAGSVEALAYPSGKGKPPLGLLEREQYTTAEVRLSAADLVLLFTDGLYEVQGQSEEFYSQTLLLADVQNRLSLPAASLFDELLAKIQRFAINRVFTDDVCLVGMEFAV